jgi:hypothetical protein
VDDTENRTTPMPPTVPPPARYGASGADEPKNPAERTRQVMFWVLAGVPLVFWLFALVESRSIIGATLATLALALLYLLLTAVARHFDLGVVEPGVQWVFERGWRQPLRTWDLAVKDLRSAIHPGVSGRGRACPQQRLGFAPATLEALEREMTPTMMTDLATEAFARACEKGKVVFDDTRPVRVFIGPDRYLGVGQWSRRYVREGGVPDPTPGSPSKIRSQHPDGQPVGDDPTRPYADFEPTRAETAPSHTGRESDPDATQHESDLTRSFSTLTLVTDGAERSVTAGVPVTVGRESTCDIVLPSPDNKIHRHHATIGYRTDGRWWLVPKGAHGVRVGQAHHKDGDPVPLSDGDTVAWGRSPKALRSQVRIR